ncbi:replication protein A 70 kDa DNA-binding subunit D-like [Primulina huaijiensis]|uniref:replication protein A 70 kDa DNA-binding subunit D-like n=1 Tax=Primulina huaijiensis TaxID=1492673 RepID=UPI003CC6F28C
MLGSSTRPGYRSMEDKCTTLEHLKPDLHNWFVKVFVSEKTPIRFTKWGRQQKLVFTDKEQNTSMQCIIYENDVDQFDKLLTSYKTYYVGNAKIKEISGNTPILAASKYQMILNRSAYIKLTAEEDQLPVAPAYHLTPFAQCHELADVANKQINLLCSVIHVFPARYIEKTKRNLQDFVVVNEERTPLILTLWEEFLQSEATYLAENAHNMPIILGMRLSVNTFYGLSIGTFPNSTILFDPPLPQTEQLKLWMKSNKEYVEAVISQRLYEKENQSIYQPFEYQIRKISQILSLTEMVKSFWVRARLKITDLERGLYFLACPSCSRPCGAAYTYEFTCFYCNHDFPSPKPLLRFQAELFDGTGSLNAYVEHKEATILLGMSAEDIITAEHEGRQLKSYEINEKIKDLQFLFQIRTSRNEARGRSFVRNTVIACLQPIELSSTSHSSEEKSSSLHVHKELLPDVTTLDFQESSSTVQEAPLPTDQIEHHPSTSVKRKLNSKEDIAQRDLKYAKED